MKQRPGCRACDPAHEDHWTKETARALGPHHESGRNALRKHHQEEKGGPSEGRRLAQRLIESALNE